MHLVLIALISLVLLLLFILYALVLAPRLNILRLLPGPPTRKLFDTHLPLVLE